MLIWLLYNGLVGLGLFLIVSQVTRLKSVGPRLSHLLWVLVLARVIAPVLPQWLALQGPGDQAPVVLVQTGTAAYQREAMAWMSDQFGRDWSTLFGQVALSLWALGGLVVVLQELQRERTLRRNLATASSAPADLRKRLSLIAERVGVRVPEVRVMAGMGSPFLWNPLSRFGCGTVLVVPSNVSDLPASVLAHELIHFKRKDHWVIWLELAGLAMHWWNPLANRLRRRIQIAAELACDEQVLSYYPEDRHAYARALVETLEWECEQQWRTPALGTARAIGWNAEELGQRLERILAAESPRGWIRGGVVFGLLAVLGTLPGMAAPSLVQFERSLPSLPNELTSERYSERLDRAEVLLMENPQSGAAFELKARALIGLERYAAAASAWRQQLELGHRPHVASYNLACCLAMIGQPEEAEDALLQALSLGVPVRLLEHDSDLDALRGRGSFQSLLSTWNAPAR